MLLLFWHIDKSVERDMYTWKSMADPVQSNVNGSIVKSTDRKQLIVILQIKYY